MLTVVVIVGPPNDRPLGLSASDLQHKELLLGTPHIAQNPIEFVTTTKEFFWLCKQLNCPSLASAF